MTLTPQVRRFSQTPQQWQHLRFLSDIDFFPGGLTKTEGNTTARSVRFSTFSSVSSRFPYIRKLAYDVRVATLGQTFAVKAWNSRALDQTECMY